MAIYVDGFVLPIPRKHAALYRRIARQAGKIWREHGALAYVECIADDVKPGKWTSFPRAVKLKKGEVVWFSWISFKSRAQRDRVNAAVLKDPRMQKMMSPETQRAFDGRRMVYGGFKSMVEA
ncbi:MAG: DUF1428 domain-containing protein [Myxococcota bacterium]